MPTEVKLITYRTVTFGTSLRNARGYYKQTRIQSALPKLKDPIMNVVTYVRSEESDMMNRASCCAGSCTTLGHVFLLEVLIVTVTTTLLSDFIVYVYSGAAVSCIFR